MPTPDSTKVIKSATTVGAAQSYIEGVYGGPTEETDEEFTITTSASRVVGDDPERLSITFINLGSDTIYIMFDNKVTTSRGILVGSNGGIVNMDVRNDQTLPTRQWWAVAGTSSSDLFVLSTRRYTYTGLTAKSET